MIGIDYCSTKVNLEEQQLKTFQLFQIVSVEETGIKTSELIAFAKGAIKDVDRYDEIMDILVKSIRRRRPNTTQDEAINIVLDFDL